MSNTHYPVSGVPELSRSARRLEAGSRAGWLGVRLRWLPSLVISWIVANVGAVALGGVMIVFGLFTTEVLLSVDGVAHADEWLPLWLEEHRTPFLTDASYVGSKIADWQVLVPLVGVVALMLVLRGRWRAASFSIQAGLVETLIYSLTVAIVVRQRPPVVQLDTFNLSHSFPSGHVAASVAVYGAMALLLTAHFRAFWVRVAIWTVAVAIPLEVAWSRLYRGQHHPVDVAAGALMGLGALTAALFAARTARAAAEVRAEKNSRGDFQ